MLRKRLLAGATPYLLLAPTFVITLVVTAYPLFHGLMSSLYDYNMRFVHRRQFIGLQNYAEILTEDLVFWEALKNTFLLTVPPVVLQIVLGMILALVMNKDFRGARAVRTTLTIPMQLTPTAVAVMWYFLLWTDTGMLNYLLGLVGIGPVNWLGAVNTARSSIILEQTWHHTAFAFLTLFSGLRGLPQEVFESASVDGATGWQTFRYITLPLLRPVILIVLLFRTMFGLRTFGELFVLTGGGPANATTTLAIYLYRKMFYFFDVGYSAALSWILVIITMSIGYVYMRWLWKEVEI